MRTGRSMLLFTFNRPPKPRLVDLTILLFRLFSSVEWHFPAFIQESIELTIKHWKRRWIWLVAEIDNVGFVDFLDPGKGRSPNR